ncbi:PadR family transcriptional regulator [Nonomuraea sp. NPDC026600]|uniref:PadR family transcriptional regulator n=1 Tax=Nonomuraea sp. NPDC026600 TaxID=3155363 RepID=UPI0033DF96FE
MSMGHAAADQAAVRLSPTSYVVLGLVGLRGPSTPYDLKRAVGHSVGYFWPFPHAQLYSEPIRLTEAGLLEMEQEEDGRRRKLYSLTADGRAALRQWLSEPVGEPFQLRNIAELKLFFAELGDADDVPRLAREQVALHRERLGELDRIAERFGDAAPDLAARLIPLQLGRELEEAALRFWERLVPDDREGS